MHNISPSENPKTPDHDPIVPVKKWKLYDEIEARTIWTPVQFETLIGWSFSMGDAPLSKKLLAWELMRLPKDDQRRIQRVKDCAPGMYINSIAMIQALARAA